MLMKVLKFGVLINDLKIMAFRVSHSVSNITQYNTPYNIFNKSKLLLSRASFCCTKKLKKLHLFLTKVTKSCIYAQTF